MEHTVHCNLKPACPLTATNPSTWDRHCSSKQYWPFRQSTEEALGLQRQLVLTAVVALAGHATGVSGRESGRQTVGGSFSLAFVVFTHTLKQHVNNMNNPISKPVPYVVTTPHSPPQNRAAANEQPSWQPGLRFQSAQDLNCSIMTCVCVCVCKHESCQLTLVWMSRWLKHSFFKKAEKYGYTQGFVAIRSVPHPFEAQEVVACLHGSENTSRCSTNNHTGYKMPAAHIIEH